MNIEQIWADAISKSISGLNPPTDINEYRECVHDDPVSKCLQGIMEPESMTESDTDSYYEFVENNMENWSNWIRSNFGTEWGLAANYIVEEGY